jgi:hypothetical protein
MSQHLVWCPSFLIAHVPGSQLPKLIHFQSMHGNAATRTNCSICKQGDGHHRPQ